MPSKKPSKADSFDEWVKATPPRPSRVCETCREGGTAAEFATRWVAEKKIGVKMPSLRLMHEHLVAEFGYGWSRAALGEHIRTCLGYSSRAR